MLLLWVLYIAAGSIVRDDFGGGAAGSMALRWYLMAVLYAGASWLAVRRGLPAWMRRLAVFSLLLGAHACLQGAWAASGDAPVDWPDWLVLCLCSVLSAAARWPQARIPRDSSTS